MFIKQVHHQANTDRILLTFQALLWQDIVKVSCYHYSVQCYPSKLFLKYWWLWQVVHFFFADNFFFRTCYLSCNSICKTVKSSDFNSYLLTVEFLSFILALFFGKLIVAGSFEPTTNYETTNSELSQIFYVPWKKITKTDLNTSSPCPSWGSSRGSSISACLKNTFPKINWWKN